MNKKSKIKSTLDSLFTGGKIPAGEETGKKAEIKDEYLLENLTPRSKPRKIEKEKPATSQPEGKPYESIEPVIKEVEKSEPVTSDRNKEKENAVEPVPQTPVPSTPSNMTYSQMESREKKSIDAEKVKQLANEIDLAAVADDGDEEHLVIFSLGKELYGVTIHAVESIIKLQAITQVPRTAAFILGVTNLRGTVVPVLDLRKRFNLAKCENTANTRIVIVNAEGSKVGIVVDEVTEVLKVSQNSIQPPPPMSTTIDSSFINGIARINDRLVILLDLEKVLQSSIRQHNR